MKTGKMLGGLLTFVFWALALICGFAVIGVEVFGWKLYKDTTQPTYQNILKNPNMIEQAHKIWYSDTTLIGATLIFAGIAYLMYVKFLQPIPDQERVIAGLKGHE